MKLVVQRVKQASVTIENSVIGKIGQGLLVFIGITHDDTKAKATWLANKLVNLRIFEDENQKLNRSLTDVGGEVLIISQFIPVVTQKLVCRRVQSTEIWRSKIGQYS